MSALNKKDMVKKIIKLNVREKVTKILLGELSRECLEYVYDSADIGMVNRLLNVLTPINKKNAVLFFKAFLGWKYDEELKVFGKKLGAKNYTKKSYLKDTFLDDASNNLWTWVARELEEPAVKAKGYGFKIAKLVDKALKDEKEGIQLKEVLFAIMSSDAVNINDLMQGLKDVMQVEVAA
jgi:hypothetical protein